MIKKLLYDRKGVAIELAILMTAVCLAVTTIVLSTALLQYENKVQAEQRMEENIIFEQIAEAFVSSKGTKIPEGFDEYIMVFSTGELEVYKKGEDNESKGVRLLKIVIKDNEIRELTKG